MKLPKPMTAEEFKLATGNLPQNDDLDRVNCQEAGDVGHFGCGWNEMENKPSFMSFPAEHRRKVH